MLFLLIQEMAAILGRVFVTYNFRRCSQSFLKVNTRHIGKYAKYDFSHNRLFSRKLLTTSLAVAAGSYLTYRSLPWFFVDRNRVFAKEIKEEFQEKQLSFREIRFNNFASVEYQGHVFMTPRDFLESITYDNPRYRTGRLKLSKAGVEKLLNSTPSRRKSSSNMFRSLGENGLISYTEYLFLLCVLTKPKSGFKIAFNMFDVDGDERVDKKEFLVLEQLMANAEKFGSDQSNEFVKDTRRKLNLWDILQESVDGVVFGGYFVEPITDTTLTIHLFGPKGRDVMNYEDFHRFMDNLQTEVLELEFAEFSCGLQTITEIEFAQILLRYTKLTKEDNDRYLNRLRTRIEHSKGISFKDFKEFCQFLNSIEDFSLAMRIYTYADHPISEADFTRAVKACTGQTLNTHLIHVVFQLFDIDGDGRLSHREFISVMKERIHRGAKHAPNTRWESFKGCVKSELRSR